MNKILLKARKTDPKIAEMTCRVCGGVKELYVKGDTCVACMFYPDVGVIRTKPGINAPAPVVEVFI